VPVEGAAVRSAAAAQVFVADPAVPVVEPDDRHHLLRVLRLRPGEVVIAADGRGSWCPCRFRGDSGGSSDDLLEPDGSVAFEPAPTTRLTVAFAPAKGDRPEWVVQKLTELGVDLVVPLAADLSVVRWAGDRAVRAVERLRRVAREAAGQSRRIWLPEVAPVHTLPALVASVAGTGEAVTLAQLGGPPPTAASTVVAVGPEGGWAPGETDLGCGTVGLGPHVLRAETAAVAAGAILAALRAGTVVAKEA
jgi:16S rRNA (uracil1498-N3)-methyltransferase